MDHPTNKLIIIIQQIFSSERPVYDLEAVHILQGSLLIWSPVSPRSLWWYWTCSEGQLYLGGRWNSYTLNCSTPEKSSDEQNVTLINTRQDDNVNFVHITMYTAKWHFYAYDKFMRVCQNGPFNKFIFIHSSAYESNVLVYMWPSMRKPSIMCWQQILS